MLSELTVNVGSICEGLEGEHADFEIDEKINFNDKNLPESIRVSAKIRIMKLEGALNVTAENFETNIIFNCAKCLKKFTHKIKIPFTERQFLFKRPADIEDLDDLYLIDIKNMTIDLKELMRQEILLHFPFIPLCSLKCKGLCRICGKDLNKGQCGHQQKPHKAETHKQMSHLKELFNKSHHGKTSGNKKETSAKPDKKKI